MLATLITVHRIIQCYQVNVEARLDEDKDVIEILTEFTIGEGIQKAEANRFSQFPTLFTSPVASDPAYLTSPPPQRNGGRGQGCWLQTSFILSYKATPINSGPPQGRY